MTAPSRRKAGLNTVWALPFALFFAVTVEMAPIGSVEHLAAAFGTDIGTAAAGSSLYALSTAVLALPLAAFSQRFNLRRATLLAGAAFSILGLATCTATDISTYLTLRAVQGAAHGAFFPLVLALAAAASPNNQGKAIARVLLGNGCALAVGVPLSEVLGAIDWRLPLAIASCGVLLAVICSPYPASAEAPSDTESPVEARGGFALIAVIFAVALAGHFSYYTFLAPLATYAGVQPSLVLAVYGASVIIATVLSGSLARGRRLQRALIVILVEIIALAVAALFTGPIVILATAGLAGACFGLLPTLMQSEMLYRSRGRQTVASGAAVVAFNLGIAVGSASGAVMIDSLIQGPALFGVTVLCIGAVIMTVLNHQSLQSCESKVLTSDPQPLP